LLPLLKRSQLQVKVGVGVGFVGFVGFVVVGNTIGLVVSE